MKALMVAGLFAVLACQSQAQTTGSIPAGSKIYVDPATGFDTSLAEALKKQNVPVTITAEKNGADYEFQTIAGANKIAGPDFASLWLHGYGEPVIRLISVRTSEVVFTSQFDRHLSLHDRDSAAGACAKRLQDGVSRSESILPSKQHPIVDF